MTRSHPIRLLIVDDHLVVRVGLRSMIESQSDMKVVAEAADGTEAVASYCRHRPDIVLLDLRMPQMNGVETSAAIREKFPEALIIILTTYDGDENIYRALQAGAHAYLLKDIPRQ